MGPSGSGKSTLLSLIAGLDRPTAGTVRTAGVELTRTPPGGLARFRFQHVGMVFQQHHLIPTLTALEATARLKEKQIVSQDVTAETVDVEARLRNLIAVRDRLRGYLDRASSVAEIIEIERELARVQGEIDALEARLEYLRSSVAMAEISLRVERPRVLGPLGLVFAGVGWTLKNLFVIR